ncbi:MAG: pantoate--beta-alanine ligase, partial [Candidatus Pelagibacter sp.]
MKIINSINKLNKDVNFKANIGFVPTMGSLHKGHISLIESAKKKCEKVLVSIFINPSQFNKRNDYKNYPKNILKDIKILNKLKVNYLFIPKTNDIYKNKKDMKIKILQKDKILCAMFR